MPFAGSADGGRRAAATLLGLELREGDELILADNSGVLSSTPPGVTVIRAGGERSPAYARNAGAERATGDWVLFLDADCRPRQGLLDAYFDAPVDPEVGALAGGIAAAAEEDQTLAARYASARNFLSPEAHLAHPYRPRAVAANLMVRRAAFEQVGGFYEGLRAAEDTDFSWRLQEAGWRLELRPQAAVEHQYRATVAALRRQWRGYAAGRAWLARRYPGFTPEPALVRAARRALRRPSAAPRRPPALGGARGDSSRIHLALDALLAFEELVGFTLSNRPARDPAPPVATVLVAERFPLAADLADTRGPVRVEAARRREVIDLAPAREITIDYREDDGLGERASALAALLARHPLRCARDIGARRPGEPGLSALAPAVRRLTRDPGARVRALGGAEAQATARRLAALAATALEPGSA